MGLKTSIISGLSLLLCVSFSARAQPCPPHTPLTYGFKDLIIQARVYGAVDRRKELSKIGKDFELGGQKFSKEELKQMRTSVGAIFCPAEGNLQQMAETAFLLGNNKEITTAGHGIVDDWGTKRDLSRCFFENFEIPPVRKALMAHSPRNIIPVRPHMNNSGEDRARIELESPIDGAKPFAPDFSEKKLTKGTQVVLVAGQHHDMKTSGRDPILSPCTVGDYVSRDGVSWMKTDCDADKGASGGVFLFRNDDGKIYAKAIEIGESGSKTPNHAPYDNNSNYEASLVIDQSFLNWYSK